jgi:DNA-binding NtrC family response regulator
MLHKNENIKLIIIDENKELVDNLKSHLETKFGSNIHISTFYDVESSFEYIDKNTQIVVLNPILKNKEGLNGLKVIKQKCPKIEVIILSNDESVSNAIELYKSGAKNWVARGKGSLNKIGVLVAKIVTAPIRIFVKEFKISKFMAIFLFTFLGMGILIYAIMKSI